MGTILLVCTGNICRSPMAEAFIRHELEHRGIEGVDVESSGVAGWEGSAATPEAVEALSEYGLDASGHRARRIEATGIEAADLIVGMAGEHRDAVSELVPGAAERTFALKELVYLLDLASPQPSNGGPKETLRSAVKAAAAVRASDPDFHLLDGDVADPLGLGMETYRAVAWEIEALSRTLVDGLFPGASRAPVPLEERRSPGVSPEEGEAR